MSTATTEPKPLPASSRRQRKSRRRTAPGLSVLAQGEPMVWLTGGALAICLVMIAGLLGLVLYFGTGTFWPRTVTLVKTVDSSVHQGEVARYEMYDLNYGNYVVLTGATRQAAGDLLHPLFRRRLAELLEGRFDSTLDGYEQSARNTLLNSLGVSPKIQFAPEVDRVSFLKQVEEDFNQAAETQKERLRDELEAALQDETGWAIDRLWEGYRKALRTLPAVPGDLPEIRAKYEAQPDLAYQLWADQMLSLLSVETSLPMQRRLIRTGNFDLTGEHFHWVSEFEISAEELPEWAIVMERIEWGRFYGEPRQFSLRHPRRAPSDEATLQETVQFFQANSYRLQDDAEREELNAALAPVIARFEKTRHQNVRSFIGSFTKEQGPKLIARVNGQEVPVADVQGDQPVDEIFAVWDGAEAAWSKFEELHAGVRERFLDRRKLEKFDIGEVNKQAEDARLQLRSHELEHQDLFLVEPAEELWRLRNELNALEKSRAEAARKLARIEERYGAGSTLTRYARRFVAAIGKDIDQQAANPRSRVDELQPIFDKAPAAAWASVEDYFRIKQKVNEETAEIRKQIDELNAENDRYALHMVTARDQQKAMGLADIVRAYPANQLDSSEMLSIYGSRWGEFLWDDPREANSEGGVFPAIWGTVAMTLIMSLVVVPFGVMAALYLREYAAGGLVVSAVRISINNLAGVPSIVFGVFGLGFFCYLLGAYVDGGPKQAGFTPLPGGRWWLGISGLAVLCIASFAASTYNLTGNARTRARWVGSITGVLWLSTTGAFVYLVATSPFFGGFYAANLPNPSFGTGGLLWSSLTLALLTLPVVIVATEEALSAVPNSLREGSYACGAGKWQTIRRIVLPHAMPGIMTGMILAMARGAGEVAPLMLVGAVKLAPELPLDAEFPFLHPSRSFMHLGFHVFDLGFQSQNSEAAKPMVYTTTLLLIGIIAMLNLVAVALRFRLKRRFRSSQF